MGKNGFLVDDIEEAAQKILYLLKNPVKSNEMGAKGKQHVLGNFLITRLLQDYVNLFSSF